MMNGWFAGFVKHGRSLELIAPRGPEFFCLLAHARLSAPPELSTPHARERRVKLLSSPNFSGESRPGSFSEPSFLQVSMQFLLALLPLCSFLLLCAETCLDTSGGCIVTRHVKRTLCCFHSHFRSLDVGDCCSPLSQAAWMTMVVGDSSFAALCQL